MVKQAGFTLIEVMIAMTICALAGIAAMQASGDHINHLSMIEEQQYASFVAENQMVELNLGKTWPPRDNKRGDEEQAGIKYYWQHKVTKTTSADMYEVKVTVFRDEAYQQELYGLISYVVKGETR